MESNTMSYRTAAIRAAIALLAMVFSVLVSGCTSTTDASDPDPHYYKGKQFTHKKTG
jgi:hypothetical protein